MNSGYVYMMLGLVSFSTLGVFHKIAEVQKCRPSAINALLYGWSALLSFVLITAIQGATPTVPRSVISIAIPFGVSAAVAILALQAGIQYGNIATSWLAINLSSGIPTLASILIYREPVSTRKALSLALIVLSMMLFWVDRKREESQS